ncbi:BAG-associated GRAM protein 1-like [Zingiber officinale]|uniref:BAG-associated GRAM protein 1-like n=1 Tax=Zingiber officinale TaxID=94328 RepID=UPI001C4C2806|nr:BAG-associated GRAM protein 1-like [Zingiber officinale]
MLLDFLFPSCWEVKVALSSALLVIAAFLTWGNTYAHAALSRRSDHPRPRRGNKTTTAETTEIVLEREDYKETLLSEEDSPYSAYLVKLELLAGKNLSGSNLDGTSDAYAIITCGSQTKYRQVLSILSSILIFCYS